MGQGGNKAQAEPPAGASSKSEGVPEKAGGNSKTSQDKPTPTDMEKEISASEKSRDKKVAKEINKEYAQQMKWLGEVPLFKRLPRDQLPLIAAECVAAEFKANDTVFKQGDPGSEFYVIKSGEAVVWITNPGEEAKKIATLKTGDYFGDTALLYDEPRSGSVIAQTDLKALKVTREKFQELGLPAKLKFPNRKAVAGGIRRVESKAPTEKTAQEVSLISAALHGNENLETMVPLDDIRIQQMVSVMWKEEVPQGKEIIREGDLVADYFYIVQEGSFEVYMDEPDEGENSSDISSFASGTTFDDASGTPKSQAAASFSKQPSEAGARHVEKRLVNTVLREGSFGELALLYLVPRATTVVAAEDSVVWVIDRHNFKSILMKVSEAKVEEYVRYLDRCEILAPLFADEKRSVAEGLIEMHFARDEVIVQQGEPGNTFYILYEGEVKVDVDGEERPRLRACGGETQYFGERALLNNAPRAATATVVSSTAKALALDRDAFDMLLGPLEEIIARSAPGRKSMATSGRRQTVVREPPAVRVQRRDLTRLGLLGCGGFGAVELWEHKSTGETYAMKGLSKGYIVKTGMQEGVMNEKDILMRTNSPFIIKLFETYSGTQTLYFLMEPALGGELYATYNRKGLHGKEGHCMFYSAGVVLAFHHLHQRHIIYRDLKPENLLLTDKGLLKLTDMGLAKFVVGKTYTTCGTPDYFAPELVSSSGHTRAVDWWTLGILVYELMSGHPPFESAYPMQIYQKVMKGIGKVNFSSKCQGPVGEFIRDLLKRDPSERLPMKQGGIANLKKHRYYAEFNWEAYENGDLPAPYVPVVKSKKDIANFSAKKEDMPKQLAYKDDGTGWDADFATF